MRSNFLFFLAVFLISTAAIAGVFPTAPTLTVGGVTFTDLTNLIVLQCFSTGTNDCTGIKVGQTTGYQVTAGKTLTIRAINEHQNSATQASTFIGYADNTLGNNSASAPTNPVYLAGSSSALWAAPATVGNDTSYAIFWPVPSQKYSLFGTNNSGANTLFTAYGYEQ